MIVSLITSLTRVTVTWYLVFLFAMFLGDPAWAEAAYKRLSALPGVPVFKMLGLQTAMKVQLHLLMYWTLPVLLAWVVLIFAGAAAAKVSVLGRLKAVSRNLKPTGSFGGVKVSHFSIGSLPTATTPGLEGDAVMFDVVGGVKKDGDVVKVAVRGKIKEAVLLLSPEERALSEELLQLLAANPDHFAGLGHGVGLLEHTFNVLSEAAPKCTSDFRLPFVAALAHDIGKLVTFIPDGKGGWTRKGWHTREGARILATLPSFGELPEAHQSALMLAIKYDHAPSKMPMLRGDKEASMLAMRIINALSAADKTATSDEKDRNLEKLQPENIIWRDFVDNLRDANVVQANGKRGGNNQLSLPSNDKFAYLFETSWREEALKRLPAEVSAALDLTRRDSGKMAKYTNVLVQVLRDKGLLVRELDTVNVVDGEEVVQRVTLPPETALWDIRSGFVKDGVMAGGAEFRGIIVLDRNLLWQALNYRINTVTDYKVYVIRPNAGKDGKVKKTVKQTKPSKFTEARTAQNQTGPEVSDGLRVSMDSKEAGVYGLGSSTNKSAPRRVRQLSDADVPPAPFTNVAGLQDDAVAAGAATSPAATSRGKFSGSLTGEVAAAVSSAPKGQGASESAKPTRPREAGLSNAERKAGIAIADEQACASYPHLSLGDKYYATPTDTRERGSKYMPGANTDETKAQRQKEAESKRQAEARTKDIAAQEKAAAAKDAAVAKEQGPAQATAQVPEQVEAAAQPKSETAPEQPAQAEAQVTPPPQGNKQAPVAQVGTPSEAKPVKPEKQQQNPQQQGQPKGHQGVATVEAANPNQGPRQNTEARAEGQTQKGQQKPHQPKGTQPHGDKGAQHRDKPQNSHVATGTQARPAAVVPPAPAPAPAAPETAPAAPAKSASTEQKATEATPQATGQGGAPRQSNGPGQKAPDGEAQAQKNSKAPTRRVFKSPLVGEGPVSVGADIESTKPKTRRSFS